MGVRLPGRDDDHVLVWGQRPARPVPRTTEAVVVGSTPPIPLACRCMEACGSGATTGTIEKWYSKSPQTTRLVRCRAASTSFAVAIGARPTLSSSAAHRHRLAPLQHYFHYGFRVAAAVAWRTAKTTPPVHAASNPNSLFTSPWWLRSTPARPERDRLPGPNTWGTQVETTNSLGIDMMLITSGEFLMGSPEPRPEDAQADKATKRYSEPNKHAGVAPY